MNTSDAGNEPADVTLLLRRASGGDGDALARVYDRVYDELKTIAANRLRTERDDHTLNATALVHEVYLRLVPQVGVEWQSRSHFYAVAAQAMRRILVDHARRKSATKRGGDAEIVPLRWAEEVAGETPAIGTSEKLIALDRALERLDRFNPRGARVVEYRFFGGLEFREIAEVLGLSEVTARRAWAGSKMWLQRELARLGPT